MTILSGNGFAKELCAVLGINKATTHSIVINATAGDVAYVDIRQYIDPNMAENITKVLTRYKLIDKEEIQVEE